MKDGVYVNGQHSLKELKKSTQS